MRRMSKGLFAKTYVVSVYIRVSLLLTMQQRHGESPGRASQIRPAAGRIKCEIRVPPRTIERSRSVRRGNPREGSPRKKVDNVTGDGIQYGRWSIRFHGPSAIRQICYWIPSRAISATTEIPVNVRGPIATPDTVLSLSLSVALNDGGRKVGGSGQKTRSPMTALYVRDTLDMRDALYY